MPRRHNHFRFGYNSNERRTYTRPCRSRLACAVTDGSLSTAICGSIHSHRRFLQDAHICGAGDIVGMGCHFLSRKISRRPYRDILARSRQQQHPLHGVDIRPRRCFRRSGKRDRCRRCHSWAGAPFLPARLCGADAFHGGMFHFSCRRHIRRYHRSPCSSGTGDSSNVERQCGVLCRCRSRRGLLRRQSLVHLRHHHRSHAFAGMRYGG